MSLFIDHGTLRAEAARSEKGYRKIQEEAGASLSSIAAAFHGRPSLSLALFSAVANALGLHVVVSFVPESQLPEWAKNPVAPVEKQKE